MDSERGPQSPSPWVSGEETDDAVLAHRDDHDTSPIASGDTRSGGFAIATPAPGTSGRPGPAS